MFNTDKPIDNISSDLLNRASFSEQLAKAILVYAANGDLERLLFLIW